MAQLMQSPDGRVFRQVEGGWQELTGAERGGAMAGADMGMGEALAVGFGREVTRLGRGAQKLFANVTGDTAAAERLAEAERVEGGIMRGTAEGAGAGANAGLFLGQIAPGLATIPLSGGLVAQAGIGAALGGLGYSGDQGLDAMTGGLLSAAGFGAGGLIGKTVGMIQQRGAAARSAMMDAAAAAREAGGAGGVPGAVAGAGDEGLEALQFGQPAAITSATRPMGAAEGIASENAERARQIAAGEKLGLKFTPAQKSGNVVEMQLEDGFRANPWTAGRFARQMEDNAKVVNAKAAEAIGEKADVLSPAVIDRATVRIGRVFEDAGEQVGTLRIEGTEGLGQATKALQDIVARESEGGVIVPAVVDAANGIAKIWESGGQITGKRLIGERSRLVKEIQKASRAGDGNAVEGLHEVVRVLDDLLYSALPRKGAGGVIGAQLKDARNEWRMLAALQTGNAVDSAGNVRPGSAYQNLRRQFPVEAKRGRSATDYGASVPGGAGMQLMDMVRVAQTVPNTVGALGGSQTATRMSIQGLLTNPLDTVKQAAIMRAAEPLLMGAPGQLARELIAAPNAAPGAAAIGAGLGRGAGIMGGP